MEKCIDIKGVRVNNLKDVSLQVPRNKFIVVTGVSGSGKSSLAFDTLYAEGQRRYVESLSSYARQFMGKLQKPECDHINGLPPAIAIQQKVIAKNPRSTVGTTTEIYDYMRLLFARIGHTYSPISGQEVKKHSIEDIVQSTMEFTEGTRFLILAPVMLNSKDNLTEQLAHLAQQGFSRIWLNSEQVMIEDLIADSVSLESFSDNEILLIVDRWTVSSSTEGLSRLRDSIETALYEGNGKCQLCFLPAGIIFQFSSAFEADGMVFDEPSDLLFSFNSPMGACPTCEGFGSIIGIDEKLVIPNTTLSVYDGCVQCWHGDKMSGWKDEFCRRAERDQFPIFTPYHKLTAKEKDQLWHGLPSERNLPLGEQVNIDSFFQMVKDNQYKIQYRVMMSRYRGKTLCPDCKGTRLKKETNYVRISGKTLSQLIDMPIDELLAWFNSINLTEQENIIAKNLLTEIRTRLEYLVNVGLGYLTLNRSSNTLSGGESQRVHLTTALGSSLVGSLYILDEPSIGLHSRDTHRLLTVLRQLQRVGNTVMVVEHDKEIIEAADYLIDIGPEAGAHGGEVVYAGPIDHIDSKLLKEHSHSHTLKYLAGKDDIPLPVSPRSWNQSITIKGARMNNLKGVDVTIPLNVISVVTGPSGSGKSSLTTGTLYPALRRLMGFTADQPGEYLSIEGDLASVKHVELIDQSPIGKSSRSNPATYTHAFDYIRQTFANVQLSKQMGFSAQYFSFNVDGGRCPNCQGAGMLTIPMQFMADVQLVCPECHGKRFNSDILDVHYHGKNIADILEMTVEDAISFFSEHGEKATAERLQPLADVGLSYLKLGQSASSLSGGENQRLKLASFIDQAQQLPTLFIFDEPTTGLHHHDLFPLIQVFNSLIARGHTVLIIEHNPDIIRIADYLIELGPGGGNQGGNLVFQGKPEEIKSVEQSSTRLLL